MQYRGFLHAPNLFLTSRGKIPPISQELEWISDEQDSQASTAHTYLIDAMRHEILFIVSQLRSFKLIYMNGNISVTPLYLA